MASANHDANHLKLSRLIDDPVAAAGTDGSEVTSAIRNDYLNRANKIIQLKVLALVGGNWSERRDGIFRYIPGLVTTQAVTWASGSSALASDYHYWLECRDSAAGLLTYSASKAQLDGNLNANIPNAFTILGSSIYAYASGVAIANGATGTLYYVKTDARAGAADTSDITIDSFWFDLLVQIAATLYYSEKGDFETAGQLSQMNEAIFNSMRP